MERTVPFLNGCISLVAFIAAFTLVVYMLVFFVVGIFDISLYVMGTFFTDSLERQSIFIEVNADMLYNLAVLIMLMKSYQILAGFMKEKRVRIENLVELAIAVSLLELIFNSGAYSDQMQMLLATMGMVLFATYAFRYHLHGFFEKFAPRAEEMSPLVDSDIESPIERLPVPRQHVAPERPRKVTKVVKIAKVSKVDKKEMPVRSIKKAGSK